ncbi:MAG: phosphoribosylformimino-5-aminoimidazole carboxamide ribotide isomerase, partial [Methanosarcinales archaeon]|nr:phosphoribosylformimino-5-aminoimidazole carboxamide ribotide isomerase [Methanosarcinales archaeon]
LAQDSNTPRNVLELVRVLNECNISDLIVLDMDRVGTSTGFDAGLLCDIVDESKHPVLLGGGVSDEDDLDALEEIGMKGALVATAIHNGKVASNRYGCA